MRNILLVMLLIVFGASKCVMDDDASLQVDSILTVKNNIDKDILFVSSFNEDTLISIFSFLKEDVQMTSATVYGNSEKDFIANWKNSLTSYGDNAVLNGFIFDKQTVIEQPWDTIVKKNMVSKQYGLTLQDLDSLEWKIVYP